MFVKNKVKSNDTIGARIGELVANYARIFRMTHIQVLCKVCVGVGRHELRRLVAELQLRHAVPRAQRRPGLRPRRVQTLVEVAQLELRAVQHA